MFSQSVYLIDHAPIRKELSRFTVLEVKDENNNTISTLGIYQTTKFLQLHLKLTQTILFYYKNEFQERKEIKEVVKYLLQVNWKCFSTASLMLIVDILSPKEMLLNMVNLVLG